jgi:hypothetical protein
MRVCTSNGTNPNDRNQKQKSKIYGTTNILGTIRHLHNLCIHCRLFNRQHQSHLRDGTNSQMVDEPPDPQGAEIKQKQKTGNIKMKKTEQRNLFEDKKEFIYLETIIGSGFEADVAKLALDDGIAYRAARKNMQIHSAVLVKVNDEFAGFFTFQNNHEIKEFCLLQSTIKPEFFSYDLYSEMTAEVVSHNKNHYPAFITTNPKSKFETPKFFESMGFRTYLEMSGYAYMILGSYEQARFKLLAHITMCNVWNSISGRWLKLKREWNALIEGAGEKASVKNPKYATRDGCWQGSSGMSNVVFTTHKVEDGIIKTNSEKSHNGNASVLDPVACEVILRFFMPANGKRVYNPFGGGVQFGFVSGHYGYDYESSEIRKNQCDANNLICGELKGKAIWTHSDSSIHKPSHKSDLVFTCPPYYKVEEYLDYDGKPPEGELNTLPDYETFRNLLFSGYRNAIDSLNENCFFVVMTGDSRDKDGGYYCCESEHELFFKNEGLMVYNKIIYLECEFTRLAHAKRTLNYRKFPKREQKIIVAYKGDPTKIKDLYPSVGRL